MNQYSYIIKHDGVIISTDNDRVNWEDENIKYSRSKSHSVIGEFVQEVSFDGDSRKFLNEFFANYGYTDLTTIEIYKYNQVTKEDDLWRTFKFDYTLLEDDLDVLKIGLIDISIKELVEARASQDYEFPIPDDYKLLTYEGVRMKRKNQIQIGEGKCEKLGTFGDYSVKKILGARSVRAYSANVTFRNETTGEPFHVMQLQALRPCTITVRTKLSFNLVMEATFENPDKTKLSLFRGYMGGGVVELFRVEGTPQSTPGTFRRDVYNIDRTDTITLGQGDLLFWAVLTDIVITWNQAPAVELGSSSAESYVEIVDISESPFDGNKIRCITYEMTIRELLKKIVGGTQGIDWNLIFKPSFPTPNSANIGGSTQYPMDIFLTSSEGLRGELNPDMFVSLENVMKSLKCHGISYDIQGNTFIVDYIANFYKKEDSVLGEFNEINDIVIKANTEYVYNKLKVGYVVADTDKQNGNYAFCGLNNFDLPITTISKQGKDKTLELIDPFIADCFSIEDYIVKTVDDNSVDNRVDNRIFTFCVERTPNEVPPKIYATEIPSILEIGVNEIDNKSYMNFILSGEQNIGDLKINSRIYNEYGAFFISVGSSNIETLCYYAYTIGDAYTFKVKLTITGSDVYAGNPFFTIGDGVTYLIKREGTPLGLEIDEYITVTAPNYARLIEFFIYAGEGDYATQFTIDNFEVSLYAVNDYVYGGEYYNLYRRYYNNIYPTGQFLGQYIYNMPLSPMRILLNNLSLISVSGWNSNGKIKYVSSDRDANVDSQMAYETRLIQENADDNLNEVDFTDPLFLPVNISFKSVHNYDKLTNLEAEKHFRFYLYSEKNNKEYRGWIEALDISIGMAQDQSVELRLENL